MALSSKKLYFRHNNTTYYIPLFTNMVTSCCLGVKDESTTLYAPAQKPEISDNDYTENNIRYFYNSNKPTIKYYDGSYTRNCLNDSETVSAYNIPAGTYTPSAFRALIEQYISNNGNRTVANAFTVTVNGQTISVSAGQKVYYTVNSSSPQGFARAVYFGTTPSSTGAPEMVYCVASDGFTNYKCYVVYNTSSGFQFTTCFSDYANYNITVGTGINFS